MTKTAQGETNLHGEKRGRYKKGLHGKLDKFEKDLKVLAKEGVRGKKSKVTSHPDKL